MEQKVRYYAGLELEKDLGLCQIYDDLEKNPDVIIIRSGRDALIHEMRYVNNYNSDREDTGNTHTGFDFHFIVFYYNGKIYDVEPASFYPFTDENDPGMYNYIEYDITDGWYKTQGSYKMAYNGIKSLGQPHARVRSVPTHSIPFYAQKKDFEKILAEQGGYREKDIYEQDHVCYDIMNTKDHRVIRCACAKRDGDGVRRSFDIDLMQKKIVG